MTLIATFRWHDGRRYMIGDTKVNFDTGSSIYEESKLLVDDDFVFGFAGDSAMCDYVHNKILDHPRKTLAMLDDVIRDAHEYALEKYPENSMPEADILVATPECSVLMCTSGSSHILQSGFHAIGSGEKFAHGFWHSRQRFSDVSVFAQAMIRACSLVDPHVGGQAVVQQVG